MFRYILKRLALFVPTLIIISLVAFWLSKVAPGDPVIACNPDGQDGFEITDGIYQKWYEDMGLNKPTFYFSFTTAAYPDTFHLIPGRYHKRSLGKLIDQYGNWEKIQNYNSNLESFSKLIQGMPAGTSRDKKIIIKRSLSQLLETYEDQKITNYLEQIQNAAASGDSTFQSQTSLPIQQLLSSYESIKKEPQLSNNYFPKIAWKGWDNQYHNWISKFVKGDFGVSCRGGRPVLDRIKTPVFWTLIMSLLAIIFTYILSVPLGVFSAIKKGTFRDKVTTTILFILYSLPTFWIGTMLLVFFTTPEYNMDWFEGAGLGNLPSEAPFWDRFWDTAKHLILPVFCLTYRGLAFVSRQMRGGMLEVLNQDYIRTAKAKGLPSKQVVWKHAFRNALFPMITLFALVLPSAITGSVVIEVIFNIPGMGREVVNAIFGKDWPVLYTILMLLAILTMLGNLLADILFAIADPRVKFSKR